MKNAAGVRKTDWCSDVSRRSACVSSTGLSGVHQHTVLHSVVSSFDGSVTYPDPPPGMRYTRDDPAERYLEELSVFASGVGQILENAKKPIMVADADLYGCQAALCSEAHGLVCRARETTLKISAVATLISARQQSLFIQLSRWDLSDPGLRNVLAEIVQVVGDARKDAQAIRASYLDLLSLVRYLSLCIRVTLDQHIIARMPEEGENSSKQQEEHQSPVETNLEFASRCVDQLIAMLEECSDFWLHVHQSELFLKAIEKDTQKIQKRFEAKDGLSHTPELIVQLAKRMDDFWADCNSLGPQEAGPVGSGYSDVEQLLLQGRCEAHIIANQNNRSGCSQYRFH